MTTKDYCLPFKNKDVTFGDDNTSKGQYNNLNLNQNNHSTCVKTFQQSKGVESHNKKVSNYALTKLLDFSDIYDSQKRQNSILLGQSKKDLLLANAHENYDKKEKALNKSKSSTLSLHISAYENSIDATSAASAVVDGIKKNDSISKKLKSVKASIVSTSTVNNVFELPRQQKDQIRDPEVMQFKASQKLLNPNEANSLKDNEHANVINGSSPIKAANIMTVTSNIIEKFETVDNPVERAAKIKDEANKFFKDEKYDIAIELYTAAINLDPQQPTYYGNRSIANLRKELFGSALTDANEAIKLDPAYVKAYFRRASANMALGKYKLALKDYESVRKFRPNDADAQKKFEECSKIVKRIAFEKAIACDYDEKKLLDSIKPDEFAVEPSYTGPRLDGEITLEFMKDLIAHFKAEKKLPIRYAYKMILAAYNFFKAQDSLVHITVPDKQKFTICGDVHGQFYDLINLFEINGLPSETNPYLFNGDFVDRGSFSVETIFTLLGWKLLYPNHFYMSRGNHESDSLNKMYGFEGEVKAKYNAKMSEVFTELFNQLPLVHVVNRKIFCCHGGLSADENVTLEQLRKLHRTRQPPEDGPMCGLLWSDPQDENGISVSKRGAGIQWGPDITRKFLEANDLLYIVRSHEVKPEGYERHHDGQVYTIFSAPNYCDTIGNKGAFINITGDNLYPPKITSFEAVSHPKVRPMAYGSSLFNFLS